MKLYNVVFVAKIEVSDVEAESEDEAIEQAQERLFYREVDISDFHFDNVKMVGEWEDETL